MEAISPCAPTDPVSYALRPMMPPSVIVLSDNELFLERAVFFGEFPDVVVDILMHHAHSDENTQFSFRGAHKKTVAQTH